MRPNPIPERPNGLGARLYAVLLEMLPEAFASLLVIIIIAAGRKLVEWLIGQGSKFFDFIPVSWVFDAGDVALLGRLVWRAIKKFND